MVKLRAALPAWVYMYMYIYIHVRTYYIYIYVHVYMKRYMYVCVCDCRYAQLHHMCIYIYISSTKNSIYICIYIYIVHKKQYLYLHIYIYIYPHVWDLLVNKTPVGGYHLSIIRQKCLHSRTGACTSLMSVRLDGPNWQIGGDVNAGRDANRSAAPLH